MAELNGVETTAHLTKISHSSGGVEVSSGGVNQKIHELAGTRTVRSQVDGYGGSLNIKNITQLKELALPQAAWEYITDLAPAGSVVLGVTAQVITSLSGTGLTTWQLGDGTTATRYGTTLAKTAGTLVDCTNYTAAPTGHAFSGAAAYSLVMHAAAGSLGLGSVRATMYYVETEKTAE